MSEGNRTSSPMPLTRPELRRSTLDVFLLLLNQDSLTTMSLTSRPRQLAKLSLRSHRHLSA